MLKKFERNDIFVNRIKTYPKVRVFTYSGSMYYNNETISQDGARLFDFLMEPVSAGPPSPVPSTVLVTEDGEYLLTEDGTFIIIE
jgi:hypothetical protein